MFLKHSPFVLEDTISCRLKNGNFLQAYRHRF